MPDNSVTLTGPYRKRFNVLKDQAQSWRAQWKDISQYMLPLEGRYLNNTADDVQNRGSKSKFTPIINGKATDAIDILAAGLQGGLTSPTRPWFNLDIDDEQLMEIESVKNWLHDVRTVMLDAFARSNFYPSIHSLYTELGPFGTAAMMIEEDFDTVIRCRPFTIGEFYLALNSKYKPVTLYRQLSMSAEQMAERFGKDNLSETVKNSLGQDKAPDRTFEVMHCIQPNTRKLPGVPDDMAFESIYFELGGGDENAVLSAKGYRDIPFVAPRWKVTSVNTYGGSRGMDALGDTKMLQKIEEKKLKGLDKSVDPPMNAPTTMKQKGGTIVAGGVNYVDAPQGAQSFTPAYQVRPDLQGAAVEIANVERRIERFFFNDLFLSIINQSKDMTAAEVAQRVSERLLILGPVLERLQSELLDIIIERTFSIMEDRGLLPEVPEELDGKEIKIQYISILAQAQREVGTKSIEKLVNLLGSLLNVSPESADKVDFDEIIDQYAAMIGVPPRVIRSDDRVADMRRARAEAQQRQQQRETAEAAVAGSKTLSEAKLDSNSMLDVVGEAVQETGGLSIPGAA